MIRANNGAIELKGSVTTLLTDLTTVTKGILDALTEHGISEEDAKELVENAFNLAFKSKKELCK